MSKLKYWFYHVLIAVDQLLNAIFGGAADETFSSRCYRGAVLAKKPKKRWRVIHKIVETLFFWEKGEHCENAYLSELKRKQYPEDFSSKG